jgi:alcohol oxidase
MTPSRPPGNFFTMFHFLEYPFSRGWIHIKSADPYATPDFDTGFMNDERDMAPMVWGYIKSRETARRMDAYAGEVETMHPFFAYDSPARACDMDLDSRRHYALPGNLSAGIQHGSWSVYLQDAERKPAENVLSSNWKEVRDELKYEKRDIEAVEEWVKRHVESTWHSLGVSCSTARRYTKQKTQGTDAFSLIRPAPWRLARATASSSTACWMSASTSTG